MTVSAELKSRLRSWTHKYLDRSVSPYSRGRTSAVALLSTGEIVPGVRVETASFPLAIPAVVNLITTAVAIDRSDVLLIAQSRMLSNPELSYLSRSPIGPFAVIDDDIAVRLGARELPEPTREIQPFEFDRRQSVDELLSDATSIAGRAVIPESNFPVGAIIKCGDYLIPGANVEHEFWPFSLCAERSAVGTAASYDAGPISDIYLSCVKDSDASPCGACRQVLAEIAPDANLWIHRGSSNPAERFNIEDLLPNSFTGDVLLR